MEYQTKKIKYISHEIKNQLSICDLYVEIIKKYCEKNNIEDVTILKSVDCIKTSVQMISNSLQELKTTEKLDLKKYSVQDLIKQSLNLSQVYSINKNINFYTDIENDFYIFVDKERFLATVINLIKNACEAFDDSIGDKQIRICIKEQEDFVYVVVSNNARPVENIDKIFDDGFTTKSTGSGIGLYICKTNIEEMCGKILLQKSDKESTDFCILLPKITN